MRRSSPRFSSIAGVLLPAGSRMRDLRHGTRRSAASRCGRLRSMAIVAACLGIGLAACGGSGPPARVGPFYVFEWRVDSGEGGTGGTTVSRDIWRQDLDGSGAPPTRLTGPYGTHAYWRDPSISPDGTRIACVGVDVTAGGEAHVFTMTSNGFTIQQLTFGHVQDSDPQWSPDGSRIAFSSDRAAPEGTVGGLRSIWTMRSGDGGGLWRVTTPPDGSALGDTGPAYSPDGYRIAFQRLVVGVDSNIWVTNSFIGGLKQLTHWSGPEVDPAWKPDGTKIAYASTLLGDGGFRIFQMNPDGTSPTITDPDPTADGGTVSNFRPTWTSDGARIWFVRRWEPGNIQGDQSIYSTTSGGIGLTLGFGPLLPDDVDNPDVHP